jgi:arabinofuranan 3-O-arabinosyltransferase
MTAQAAPRSASGQEARPSTAARQTGPEAAGRERSRPPMARWFFLVWLVALGVLLLNDPGRMVFDTKLGVDIDPSGYFAGLWHLWDPLDTFGTLNNQAIGYAVPMAPFYLAGQLAHVPVWLTERLWLSLIIAVGFSGLVKLATALGIGSPVSRFVAGLMFALWPTYTIVIGSTSAAVLPGMLAPWAVLPLVHAVSRRALPHWHPWREAVCPSARSGLAVLLMGGVNATSTIDALVLPGLLILTYARGRRLIWLAVSWGAAVAAATAWWALPLLLQGRYAFNFLPYVEQSATTTATASADAILRGTGNWVAYFNLGTAWLPAGWLLVTTQFAIAAAAFAAACGLYGLASRSLPAAAWLRLSIAVAAAGALAGYSGPLGSPYHRTVDHLLDGTLAPFRNVYKLEPVIAAVLALGMAHAAANWLTGETGRPRLLEYRQGIQAGTRIVTGLVLIGLALPYLSNRVLNPGSFTAVPQYWSQVAGFLAAQSPRNPALVVPGDAHGDYLWGDPIDDPLVALATSPWVERQLVPYGGAGSQNLLDTAEKAVESGEQVPGFAAYLARAGIRYIVVRNDLDPQQIGYTSPVIVHQSLVLSGFARIASFGPLITGAQTAPRAPPEAQAAQPSYPAVEIYAASAATISDQGIAGQPLSPVSTMPVSQTVLVNGGPDSLLQVTGQNVLGPSQPAIIAGDQLPVRPAGWAVTDGQQRADTAFGLINSDVSYTYTANETNPVNDQLGAAGTPPRQLLPVPAAGHQTVAVLSGAASVAVSSYGSWLANTQQEDPASVFDGNPATAWAEGNSLTPVGQWVQINFDRPLDLPSTVGIRLLDDSPKREIAARLQVSTAAGSTTSDVFPTGATQSLNVTPGRTGWLRITISGADRVTRGGPGAGISDVLIPGVSVTRLLRPAEDPAGQRASSVSFSFRQPVPSPRTFADPAAAPTLARTFTTPAPVTLKLNAAALALPGSGLDSVLDRIAPPGKGVLQVSVASTAGALPAQFPASLIRGTGLRPWLSDTANPVIHLSWRGKRRITSMVVEPVLSGTSVPETVKITSPDGTRVARIGFGVVEFQRPLTTNRMDVSFPQVQQATAVSSTGQVTTLPIGLTRLSVPALADLRVAGPNEQATFTLACGQGPALSIDGQVYQTTVSGTIGALSQYLPLRVGLCTPDGTLALGAGQHTLIAATPGTFAVTDLSASSVSGSVPGSVSRPVTIHSWQTGQRRLTVGPGPASYLEVHENYNTGWTARLNGRPLTAVRLDGWQQGFVVPAGAGGTVVLTFGPTASYHLALAISLFAVIVLLAIVAWSFAPGLWRARPYGSGAVGSGAVGSGADGSGPYAAVDTRRARVARWLALLGVLMLIFLVGGRMAIVVPILALVAWWQPRLLTGVALAAMALSGLLVASAAQPTGGGLGAFGAPAQACALIALAAALLPGAVRPRKALLWPWSAATPQSRASSITPLSSTPPMAPVASAPAATPLSGSLPAVPFGIVDELSCYFDSAAEPNNVHLEVSLPGRLGADELRMAVRRVLAAQPKARARRVPGGWWRRQYAWEFPPPSGHVDAVEVAIWRGTKELDSVRGRFLAAAPPLDHSPPFRLLLARGPEQDSLILNAHHAAFDGHSCLLLLRQIAAEYSGLATGTDPGMGSGPPKAGPAEPEQARLPEPEQAGPPEHEPATAPADQAASVVEAEPAGEGMPLAASPAGRAARIASHHGNGATRRAPGYGFRLLRWPDVPTASRDGSGPHITVNDLLLVALIKTIRWWNATARHRLRKMNAGRPVRISMPADARPPGHGDELGNLSRLSTVTVPSRDGTDDDLLAAVAIQTQTAKRQLGPQVGRGLTAVAKAPLPTVVKRLLLRLAVRLLGRVLSDTSLISNLGNVGDPPEFGQLSPSQMWFSTSAHMPRGLSVGAVTVGGRLHLCFRYRHALLTDAAASQFAAGYAAALKNLADSPRATAEVPIKPTTTEAVR